MSTTHQPIEAVVPPCDCDEAEALLPLVADGSLDQAGDPALFAHLATCGRCQESLARHDLVTVALERAVAQSPAPLRLRRPAWRRWAPLAAAAALVVGCGVAIGLDSAGRGTAPVVATHAPAPAATAPVVAVAPTAAAPAGVVPAAPAIAATAPKAPATAVAAHDPAPHIDIEVVTVPGSRPAHPLYLVRKGDQVLLVDPTANEPAAAPSAALPASYSEPRRY